MACAKSNVSSAHHPASNRDSSGEIIMFMFGVEPNSRAIHAFGVSCILGRGPTPADANPSTRGLIWIRAHTA